MLHGTFSYSNLFSTLWNKILWKLIQAFGCYHVNTHQFLRKRICSLIQWFTTYWPSLQTFELHQTNFTILDHRRNPQKYHQFPKLSWIWSTQLEILQEDNLITAWPPVINWARIDMQIALWSKPVILQLKNNSQAGLSEANIS